MNEVTTLMANGSKIAKPVYFPRMDGSRIPYEVYSSPEIYDLEEERIFRGPTWSFVALEVELPNPGDFKSTFRRGHACGSNAQRRKQPVCMG